MSQPSVASYFNTRKRPAGDEIITSKNKVFVTDCHNVSLCNVISGRGAVNVDNSDVEKIFSHLKDANSLQQNLLESAVNRVTRSTKIYQDLDTKIVTTERQATVSKRSSATKSIDSKLRERINKLKNGNEGKGEKQQKLVNFIKKGLLSPKHLTPKKDGSTAAFGTSNKNISTPTKETPKDALKSMVRKELTFDEVKTKVTRSAKLQELKASINRIQELEKTRKAQENKNAQLRKGEVKEKPENAISLKEFKTIDLEVLASPVKGFKTPVKLGPPPAPDKNQLMSPKSTTPKRLLFSPSKDGQPAEIVQPPAYQKYMHLLKSPTLSLPFKYRSLVEIFKAIDSVCAMYFNRKECITFKKLKSAVQRMIRRNFYESHLAQIKHLYPEAYYFYQTKMRNYGSISKQDYFQLVITPNIGLPKETKLAFIDEDDVLKSAQSNALNPQMLIERVQKFQSILLEKVKSEHEQFLKSLDPPIFISSNEIKRWHPEFDLENCPEIEQAPMPQPPNVEKYSSAKDILSTARNLFNRNEEQIVQINEKPTEAEVNGPATNSQATQSEDVTSTLLKGVPQSLLEKIRAKQAAKAHEAMTRRPSQDQEATKYSRLPVIARHLRNVFVTEKKGVLTLEIVMKKIENSYRTSLTHKDIELHLQLIAKECAAWIQFHDIRKTRYLKMHRDMDLTKIIKHLEKVANSKSN